MFNKLNNLLPFAHLTEQQFAELKSLEQKLRENENSVSYSVIPSRD
ncbi:MAG: hypothetical protein FD169_1473 [Bacillota bacterium]|nr:MAG: hypothetical protein FD169_1473 [Bacillota bacterium]MBS3950198.1 hypothetical protein [Peptococcaceae bacterium]